MKDEVPLPLPKATVHALEFILIHHSLQAARWARENKSRLPVRHLCHLANYAQSFEDPEVEAEIRAWEDAFATEPTPQDFALWLADRVGENVGRKQTALIRAFKYFRKAFPGES
jgi:hypothetical protein